MNIINIIGRVGQEPKLLNTQSGNKFYSLNVVSNSKKNGEEKSTWYNCSLFNYSEKFIQYVKKGSAVIITGTLQTPYIYEARDGSNKVSLDVIVNSINFSPFSGKKEEEEEEWQVIQEGQAKQEAVQIDEDLPF